MRLRSVLLVSLAIALMTVSAGAQKCVPTTSRAEVDTGPDAPMRIYVANDPCPMCMFSIWVYQESNGIDGLQRQDEVKDDTCGGPERGGIEGDTIIF